jgi:hypothetical protein
MQAQELIAALGRRGLKLYPESGYLIAEPAHLLTDTDRSSIRAAKADLLALFARPPADTEDRVEIRADATPESLIDVCRKYGVGLRIDPDGMLVVESYGKAWRALVGAIAAHVDEIASILLTTGDGRQFSVRRCDA